MKTRLDLFAASVVFAALSALAAPVRLHGAPARAADKAAPSQAEAAPAQENPPAGDAAPAAEGAPAGSGENLDVTVTGEAKDEIPVLKEPPSLDVPLKDVAGLAREGQIERILTEEVSHMSWEQQSKLMAPDSRQTAYSLPARLPAPPFFRMEVPHDKPIETVSWEFSVVDQANRVVKSLKGEAPPEDFFVWDGFEEGRPVVRAGPAYSPVLLTTDKDGKARRFFGEPIQLDALQYEQAGILHVEFVNDRLYDKNSADFSKNMLPLVKAAVDQLRRRAGAPFRLVVHDAPPAKSLTDRRLEKWKALLADELLMDPKSIVAVSSGPGDRGRVTSLQVGAR
ncbi:MAG: hypothetical protein ACT4O3_05370 [Elusimicrobiota bacterium]|jgi:hypothetical protein